jgi:hypothetical protein
VKPGDELGVSFAGKLPNSLDSAFQKQNLFL